MLKTFSRLLSILLLLSVLLLVFYFYWSANRTIPFQQQSITINKGDSVGKLARQLVSEKVLYEPYSMILWSYLEKSATKIKPGEYRLKQNTSIRKLLKLLVIGKTISYPVTFIEGWTFKEMLNELSNQEKLNHTLDGLNETQVIKVLELDIDHYEGQFFPDTYNYNTQTSDIEILQTSYQRMQQSLSKIWQQRDTGLKLKNSHEALVLASIIEKETGLASERRRISAVFHNRLNKGMKLQTDPTVIYGLGEQFDGNLKRKHLRQNTPYNTYYHYGLPPTPIAMPGYDSIYAAVHPEQSDAIYFVARGDGSHQFSQTLNQHNQAVIKYQLKGKKRAFSSLRKKAISNNE